MSVLSALNIQTVLVGVVVVLVIYKLIQRLKYKLPPGPTPIPLIGNYGVMKSKFWFEACYELSKTYGPVFTIYFGPLRTIILNDIDVVTEALIKKKADFAGRPFFESMNKVTQGMKDIAFASYTPTWKLHRKIAGKALRQYLMGDHLEKVVHDSMTKCLTKMAEETGPFDPEPYIDLMVFNILNAVCYGESCDLDDPEFQQFMKLDKGATELFGKGFIEDLFPAFLTNIWSTQRYKKAMGLFEELYAIFARKFKEHEETFDPDNIRDFTDSLILAKREAMEEENEEAMSQLTNTHLVQTLADIFGAGIDTSRLTLYFVTRYMAGLPDIQSKVHEELDRVVGKDRLPGLKDRDNLSYCEATLHEIMRLGTVAPMGVAHSTLCDTQVGGYDVPKDTMVMINHWALHRDPNYWKDVEKFDPTRFLDENGKLGMKPESWLPFSAGRRVCLGEGVAKPELHLIFASIFQRFKITLPEGTNPEMECAGSGVVVQPAPFKIIVQERK